MTESLVPGTRRCQELLSVSKAESHTSLVTSDTEHPRWKTPGHAQHPCQQPQAALGCKCHPAMGQLPPQDTSLLQLFSYKAPKKQTLWFVQREMWNLLIKELGRNHAKASAHSSSLKKKSQKSQVIFHRGFIVFYQVQVTRTGKNAKHINMNYFSGLLCGFSHKN